MKSASDEQSGAEVSGRAVSLELDAVPTFGNFALSIAQGECVFRSRMIYNLRALPKSTLGPSAELKRSPARAGFFGFNIDSNSLVRVDWMKRGQNLAGCKVRVVHNGKLLGLPISPGSRVFPLSFEEFEVASASAKLTVNES